MLKSNEIEDEILDYEQVHSSITRRLGIEMFGMVPVDRGVECVVEMLMDATQNYQAPLTAERIFGWHAAMFPAGRGGLHKITVRAWRTHEMGPMPVASGPMGQEKIAFSGPPTQLARADGSAQCFYSIVGADSERA